MMSVLRAIISFLIILAFYSFIINYIFGHKTFWRHYPADLWRKIRTMMVNILTNLLTRNRYKKKINEKDSNSFHLQNLHESILIYCFTFLHPHDILQISRTSQSMKLLSNHSYLWEQYKKRMVDSSHFYLKSPEQLFIELQGKMPQFSNKMFLFYAFQQFSLQILNESLEPQATATSASSITAQEGEGVRDLGENSRCFVMIDGNVYDLTRFQSEHPGGIEVLQGWKGKDASKPFKFAYHSFLALDLAKSFMIWSKEEILGVRARRRFLST